MTGSLSYFFEIVNLCEALFCDFRPLNEEKDIIYDKDKKNQIQAV